MSGFILFLILGESIHSFTIKYDVSFGLSIDDFIISRKVVSIPTHQLEIPFTKMHYYEVYACEMPNAIWPAHRKSEYLLPLAACL